MGWLKGLLKQVRVLLRKDASERELEEELSFHIEMETQKNLRQGLDPGEARRTALVAFGGVERYKEQVREARWVRWVEDFWTDVRYATRGLTKAPLFTLVAVLTIALGIGANSGLFGLVNGLLFRGPNGLRDRDGLVWIDNGGIRQISFPDYVDLGELTRGTIEMAAYASSPVSLGADEEAVRASADLVSANYFDVLGVGPVLGRGFSSDEDQPGSPAVAVLGHAMWQRSFGEDPEVLGSTVRVNGHPFVVVGVAPPGFVGLDLEQPAALWVPISAHPQAMPRGYDVLARSMPSFGVVGRLARGLAPGMGATRLARAAATVEAADPGRLEPLRLEVAPVRGWLRSDHLSGLLPIAGIAWAITASILLIACANVAGLMLARSVRRRSEIGIRMAMGAGLGRLTRLLLTEAVVLVLAGALLGVLLASWMASLFQARAFAGLGLAPLEVWPDARTFVFALVLATLSVAFFGLLPVARVARGRAASLLLGGRGGGVPRSRLQNVLVVGQLALGVVLLFCSALFLRRLQTARDIEVGYDAEQVVAVTMDLGAAGYQGEEARLLHRSLVEAIRDLPGVSAASGPSFAPFTSGAILMAVSLPGPSDPALGGGTRVVALGVAGRYFETMGIRLVEGRPIMEDDLEAGETVAVVSEALARRHWPGQSPIGRRLVVSRLDREIEIIGLAREIVSDDLYAEPWPQVYLPATKLPQFLETNVLVRVAGDPEALLEAIRSRVAALDPAVSIVELSTVGARIDRSLSRSGSVVDVVLGFGALAFLLAGLGVYGIVALTVAGRTREIGIRMALGARAEEVVWDVLSKGARLGLAGLSLGAVFSTVFAFALTRAVEGIEPIDPWAAVLVAAALFGVVLLASWAPARRAARVEPSGPLRQE